ncbi:MAG: hypothetical protein PHN90_13915 [Methanothrix sp.]|jgi:hypothetical protein|nr:hypothetical protein [Methanothrix sp.]HNR58931.1 hypothetical protein [Methanothrix sp.]HOI69429.1 hypothetical protein [Methanothrix sp.]
MRLKIRLFGQCVHYNLYDELRERDSRFRCKVIPTLLIIGGGKIEVDVARFVRLNQDAQQEYNWMGVPQLGYA